MRRPLRRRIGKVRQPYALARILIVKGDATTDVADDRLIFHYEEELRVRAVVKPTALQEGAELLSGAQPAARRPQQAERLADDGAAAAAAAAVVAVEAGDHGGVELRDRLRRGQQPLERGGEALVIARDTDLVEEGAEVPRRRRLRRGGEPSLEALREGLRPACEVPLQERAPRGL